MFKFRTKIEAVIFASFLLVIGAVGAINGTRHISSSHDPIFSQIRNTNGKVFDVSQANLQLAINNLNNVSGIVWVGGDFSTTMTITIQNNITVDLCNHKITYVGIGNCIELKRGSRIINGCIDASGSIMSADKAAIYVDGSSRINLKSDQKQTTGASHMTLIGNSQSGNGVFLNSNGAMGSQEINHTSWDDITTSFFAYGYHLEAVGSGSPGAFVNNNVFIACYDDSSKISYYLHQTTSLNHAVCGVDGNQFITIITQASSSSPYYYSDYVLYCEGQNNSFNGLFGWDWSGGAGVIPVYFGTGGTNNYLASNFDKAEITDVNEPDSCNIYVCWHSGEIYAENWFNH
jgi:hypothetical protein